MGIFFGNCSHVIATKPVDKSTLVYVMAWLCQATSITWANVDPDLCHYVSSIRDVELTHWGRVTHICVSKLTNIGSDNGLSPGRRQTIIWTNDGILLIGPLGTNFSEILIGIQTISFKKMHFKMSSGKWRSFCLGLNVLIITSWYNFTQFHISQMGCYNYVMYHG